MVAVLIFKHFYWFRSLLDMGVSSPRSTSNVSGWLVVPSTSTWSMASDCNDDSTDHYVLWFVQLALSHQPSGCNSLIGARS